MKFLRPRSMLRAYQNYLVREIIDRMCCLLAVDMGLGKTVSVLTAIRDLFDDLALRRVLIIAPKRVAQHTWPDEIGDWEHTREMTYSVIVGTPAERKKALAEKTMIHIINRENLLWLYEQLEDKEFPYDMIVYDESSRLKSWRHRTKNKKLAEFGVVARFRSKVKRMILLSGTPAPNGLKDLGGQSYILDLGERLGTAKTHFLNRWFYQDRSRFICDPHPWSQADIMERLKDVMICLRSEDYIELPEPVPNVVAVELPKAALEEYKRFEKDMVSDVYDVEAASKGVLTNKLLQFANGSIYRDIEGTWPVQRQVIPIHDAKMAALEEIMNQSAGQPVLVAYNFKFDLAAIQKKFPKAKTFDELEDPVNQWNRGEVPMLLVHPASVGHGLNIQMGGHIIVWYGLTWSLELYQQLNKRLWRPGQPNNRVVIHHIIAQETVDHSVLGVMRTKGATQDQITNVVRKRILSVAGVKE